MDETTMELLKKLHEVTQTKKEVENEEKDIRSQLERRLNSRYPDQDQVSVPGVATITRVPEKSSLSFSSKDVLTFANALKASGNPIGEQLLTLQSTSSRKAHIRIDWD
jgi:hypothetical protein